MEKETPKGGLRRLSLRWVAEGNRSPSAVVCREGDPRAEWSMMLVSALGSWGKLVPCGHIQNVY